MVGLVSGSFFPTGFLMHLQGSETVVKKGREGGLLVARGGKGVSMAYHVCSKAGGLPSIS